MGAGLHQLQLWVGRVRERAGRQHLMMDGNEKKPPLALVRPVLDSANAPCTCFYSSFGMQQCLAPVYWYVLTKGRGACRAFRGEPSEEESAIAGSSTSAAGAHRCTQRERCARN